MTNLVVLPTYNEADNLPLLVASLWQQVPGVSILVVDDNSPDGTGQLADKLAAEHPGRLRVLHRSKKEGLGKAYLAAFAEAVDGGAERILQMDVDFSHPVSLVPLLFKELDDCDLVLGSRYIKGGGTRNWDWKRRLLSRGGNYYARRILGLSVRDLTGGFKAFRRPVLEYLLQCPIDSAGYNFQIEMTAYAVAAGFRCREVPFIFVERERGVSKMSRRIVGEALLKTFQLRRRLLRDRVHMASGEEQQGSREDKTAQ